MIVMMMMMMMMFQIDTTKRCGRLLEGCLKGWYHTQGSAGGILRWSFLMLGIMMIGMISICTACDDNWNNKSGLYMKVNLWQKLCQITIDDNIDDNGSDLDINWMGMSLRCSWWRWWFCFRHFLQVCSDHPPNPQLTAPQAPDAFTKHYTGHTILH